jgi:dihydropyrimidine dehydrogenase (NAD+) subunit PreT
MDPGFGLDDGVTTSRSACNTAVAAPALVARRPLRYLPDLAAVARGPCMTRKPIGDIAPARLRAAQLAEHFADVEPPLDRQAALLAAQRCYYCFDAPCITACPTGIDIPSFIRRIGTDNLRGAASDILSANIMGGTCARVCPTEILCEGACVRNVDDDRPVRIGALQRYATDWVFDLDVALFTRAAPSGRKIAVVGAGPAGLSCAHGLARAGHEVVVFDRREKAGGLNEYGIAEYKVPGFAQREVDWLLSIGGIELRLGQTLGRDITLAALRQQFDAVFIGTGLAGVNALGVDGEALCGVRDAVDFIAELRQCADLSTLPIGRRVVVIGGGNTAVDAAVQSRRLGAEQVSLVYRRGSESMSATSAEQEFARSEGVNVITWARPKHIHGHDGMVRGVEFEYTRLDDGGRLVGTGEPLFLDADQVMKAIGQLLIADPLGEDGHDLLELVDGRIVVDEQMRTSLAGVWAGGDCIGGHVDLTVQAVEDGKRAARAIDQAIMQAEIAA